MEPSVREIFAGALRRRRDEALAALWQIEARSLDERNLDDARSLHTDRGHRALIDYMIRWYRSELTEIDQALERIRQQSYGNCRSCNRQIDLRWLEAFPEIELCRRCQTIGAGRDIQGH